MLEAQDVVLVVFGFNSVKCQMGRDLDGKQVLLWNFYLSAKCKLIPFRHICKDKCGCIQSLIMAELTVILYLLVKAVGCINLRC